MKISFSSFIIVLVLLLYPITSFCQLNQIIISVPNNMAPYSFIDKNNEYQGFTIDIIQNIFDEDYFIHLSNNSDTLADIIGIISLNETPRNFEFIPIPHSLNYVVFKRKETLIESLAELYNKKIIIKKGDLPYDLLYTYKTSHILTVDSYNKALNYLESGINDCAILPFQSAYRILDEINNKNIEFINTPFQTYQCGYAINKNNVELIKHFKSQLNNLINSGEYELAENNWFENNIGAKSSHKTFYFFIIILAIVVLILLYYNKLLQNEINQSTIEYIKEISNPKDSILSIDLNNEILSKIIEQAPISLFINDYDGKIVSASNEFLIDTTGTNKKKDGLFLGMVLQEETARLFSDLDKKLYSFTHKYIAQSIQIKKNDKTNEKWVLKFPIKLANSNNTFILNILTKPFLEGNLSFSKLPPEFLFKEIINSLPDIIFYKNITGEYIGGNSSFNEFVGKPENEIIGKKDNKIFTEEKALSHNKSDKTVFETGEIWEEQNWDVLPNGDQIKLENIKIPLKNKEGKTIGLVGISHDITRHHIYEQELDNAKKQAENLDRTKSSFLANMSHEIRTPMNTIIGFSDLLADPDLTYDQRMEITDMIQSNGYRLIDVIDDIIDISMIESGQLHMKFTDFNINSIIKDAFNYAENKKVQIGKDQMHFTFNLGSITDEFIINSDPFRLRQVLKNLVNATIRYSSSESIFIGYLIHKGNIILYIKNDKPLIDSKEAEDNLNRERKEVIGLSDIEEVTDLSVIIAKSITEKINGNIVFDDYNNGETNFYFSIPFEKVTTKETLFMDMQVTEHPKWLGKNILIAEDEETNFMILNGIMTKTGANILHATNGQEAIDIYTQEGNIDLILMDIRMPILNGIEATREIINQFPDAIIIAQTAFALPEDKEQYVKIGMKGVIAKPIDPGELFYLCGRYIS